MYLKMFVFLLSSVAFVGYTIRVRNHFYRLKKAYENKESKTLFGHGVVTMVRGIRVYIEYALVFPLLIIALTILRLRPILEVFIIGIYIATYMYPVTEIKHLSDGLSRYHNHDARLLYKQFFTVGLWGIMLSVVIAIFLAKLSLGGYLFILVFCGIAYVMSMSDLLQSSGIDMSDLEDMKHMYEIPWNIGRAIFLKEHREKALQTLRHNSYHIKRGLLFLWRNRKREQINP